MYPSRSREIKKIVEKLKKIGIDNLVGKIWEELEVFKKEYPLLWETHGFPLDYLNEIWARKYEVTPSMVNYDFELERIKTQVNSRVRLRYNQSRAREHEKVKQEKERAKEVARLRIENANFDELVEEALEYLEKFHEQNITDMERVDSRYHIDSLLHERYNYSSLDAMASAKFMKVKDEVYRRWLEKRWLESEEYKELHPAQKQKLEEFRKSSAEKLADDLVDFFLKYHKPLIFNHNPTYLKPVFNKFWSDNYPFWNNLRTYRDAWTFYSKRREAKQLTVLKLREVEKEEYAKILKFMLEWASRQNKTHMKHPEIKGILESLTYRGAPQRLVEQLYAEVNYKLTGAPEDNAC